MTTLKKMEEQLNALSTRALKEKEKSPLLVNEVIPFMQELVDALKKRDENINKYLEAYDAMKEQVENASGVAAELEEKFDSLEDRVNVLSLPESFFANFSEESASQILEIFLDLPGRITNLQQYINPKYTDSFSKELDIIGEICGVGYVRVSTEVFGLSIEEAEDEFVDRWGASLQVPQDLIEKIKAEKRAARRKALEEAQKDDA